MSRKQNAVLAVASAMAAVCLWAYWTGLLEMADKWSRKPEYSHGWLVPLFALFLLGSRRSKAFPEHDAKGQRLGLSLFGLGAALWLFPTVFGESAAAGGLQWGGMLLTVLGFGVLISAWLPPDAVRPNWWGLPLLVIAIAGRLIASRLYLEWFDFISLVPFALGLVLLIGGWQVLHWSWPAIVFLFFMIPLPFTLEVALRDPLRRMGTIASTYVMQTVGLPAFSEGTVIVVDEHRINVVEACSGMRMLMIFFALSLGIAFLMERPLWQRIIVTMSALPIAIISNVARITVTGLIHVWGYSELADVVFHDLAGWLMMPFALVLLGFELWFLDHLFIVDEKRPLAFGMGRSPQELRDDDHVDETSDRAARVPL